MQAFSTARAPSSVTRTPRLRQSARTARRFSRLTGWPPAMLTGAPTATYAIWEAPTFLMRSSSFLMSTLPLKGASQSGSWAESTMTSLKIPPASSMCARVVVKYMFPATNCPGLIQDLERRCSAPRP